MRTLVLPFLLVACHTAPDLEPLTQDLVAPGFTVKAGSFEFLDLTDCCDTSCSGNNPSSPYAALFVPPAPGQPPEPHARPDGLSSQWRLGQDEAIVFVGPTPPRAAYFGFTPYLMERADAQGTRKTIFASLSETLNQLVIGTEGDGVFEQRTAVIVATNRTTATRVEDALVASGIPARAINLVTLDPAIGRFGFGATADTFGVLFRLALVEDEAKKLAYLMNPGAAVYRLTPTTPIAAAPLPSPVARPKATSPSEAALEPAVQRLQSAIVAAYPAYRSRVVTVGEGTPDPAACIANLTPCAGDNRDTNYPGSSPRRVFERDTDFYIVFGVDHQRSGKTVYSNASVYALDKLVGLASVASDEYPGSARKYLPLDPSAPALYAWKIARTCAAGEPFCLAIPKGTCPTGMPNGALGTITFRTYLEPSSKTAPLTTTLVPDRILKFEKR